MEEEWADDDDVMGEEGVDVEVGEAVSSLL